MAPFVRRTVSAPSASATGSENTTVIFFTIDRCALPSLILTLAMVGGGSVSTLVLMLYGTAIHVAVGISGGIGVLISILGTVGFMVAGWPQQALMPPLSIGYVSLIGVVLMAPIAAAIAPLGARLAHSMPKRRLEIAFGLFLLAVAIRFLISLL
jgi:uncharacterized membrane protein YfcA